MQKVSRNAPCPCGSGKKYKRCCITKDFDWVEMEGGKIGRQTPLTPEAVDILRQQREKFVAHFGRDPNPDEPVFFDAPHPEHLEAEIAAAMREAGLNPGLIYAFEKTGRIVTEENMRFIPEKDLDEYHAAIDEYWAMHNEDKDEE